ncbi:MAG: UDP-N-acetylmuramoyl-L-alanine--D-glutamate ligase [Oscillospiraceae bacterium]|nr:UDP-N-acetylmuramoyl-L-alanine--D-glutamate ligase [Oscillospiraceae bacterium]MDD4414508.1 UDP-N-acetylmuramoyl-L-alanine--D-glutamate ligase [Oscillospiraceae bacterium]
MSNHKAADFFKKLEGQRVAVCGIGRNNIPVVHQFLNYGAVVTACDRRTREELGGTADELEKAGAALCLGENYLDSLAETRSDLILRTPGMKPYLPQFEEARSRGVTVTSEMELFFSLCPAKITAVTGSDGKTTTTTIIAGLLEAAGYRVHLGGNIGRPLLPIINEIMPEDEVVIELSSFQLTGMKQSPHTAVITNIAPNHLDWHTDMQEYVDAKKNLFKWQNSADRIVLNADESYTTGFAGEAVGQLYMFSRNAKPDRGAWLSQDGIITMTKDGQDTRILPANDILIPGVHNIENYLAAISAVWGKVAPDLIPDYAKEFGGVPHRCEFVRKLEGVKWYNDSMGSSPSRTIAGLKSFDRKVILIAGGYDKHIPYTPLGETAQNTVKAAILLGATAGAIEKAIREYSSLPIYRVGSMEEAVKTASKIATSGDIVFMSPASASFDMYKNFEERGNHFKSLVAEIQTRKDD